MKKIIALLVLVAVSVSPLAAEVVYLTARTSGSNSGPSGPNTDGTYTELPAAVWSDTTSKSSVSDATSILRPGARFRSSALAGMGFSITPPTLVDGGVYKIEASFNASLANGSTDILVDVSSSDGQLSTAQTTAFQRSQGGDKWGLVGFITNNVGVASPTITFVYNSGTISGGARWLVDVFKVTLVETCLDVPSVKVTGPLFENGSHVVVTNVSASATALNVYQHNGSVMVPVGSLSSGLTTTNNLVPVSGLIKGRQVTATQVINGQEGCVSQVGTIVGGGANSRVRLALMIKETTSTGPVGTTGTGPANIHFLGASTRVSGGGPAEGRIIEPSADWQTVTLQRGPNPSEPVDPSVKWNAIEGSSPAGTQNDLQGEWGTIEGIAFAIDDLTDSGPFDIYIDSLQNGSTVFEDFEGANDGAPSHGFWYPTFSGSTSGNLLSWPTSSAVTTTTAATGAKSLRVGFQWNGTDETKWLRLTTSGVTSGVSQPQVNLNDPISFNILLLPVGATPPPPTGNPTLAYSVSGGQITFTWTGPFVLQEADTVTGVWNTISGAISGHQVNTSAAAKFYRLRN